MPIQNLDNPVFISVDLAGRPNASGSVEVYVADGLFTTLATVYSDQVKTSELANPVTLDPDGTKEIWYDVKVDIREKTAAGAVIRDTLNLDPNASQASVQGFNLCQNGSFEIDSTSDGQPDNWTVSPYTGSAIAITESVVTNGAKALEFNVNGAGTGGGFATSALFPVTENTTLSISFSFFATNATTTNQFLILWSDETGSSITPASTAVTMPASGSVPTSWTNYQEDITVPADATQAVAVIVGIASSGSNLGSKAYFDGISIIQLNGLVTEDGIQTLTNKTLTDPVIECNSGELTIDTKPVYGLVMLDTPTSLVSGATGLTDDTWQSYTGSDLSSLSAKLAIIYIVANQETSTSIAGVDAEIHVRKGGSSVTNRPVARFVHTATTAENRRAWMGTECIVELDSNGYFDYKFDNGGNQTWGATIVLNGYYV